MMTNSLPIKRALISVSDKTGIVEVAKKLKSFGVEIVSTGGTAKLLTDNGINIIPIQEVTGNPEAFGGRMKSISFQVGSALLFRRNNEQDLEDIKKLNIRPIDLVICNLYPFDKVVAKNGKEDELIENIDIGGPTMIRAAAKNYESVTVLTDPSQYHNFLNEYQSSQTLTFEKRREFALEAFKKTAQYDLMISNKLAADFGDKTISGVELSDPILLRYGENPHQSATFYKTSNKEGHSLAEANVLQGKALSYNNLLDADAAWKACSDAFNSVDHLNNKYAVSVVKHLNPCGLAVATDLNEALELAWKGDPVSAFGGIICFSHEVTGEIAHWFDKKFVEIIIAPSFTQEALNVFGQKKNLRLLQTPLNDSHTQETVIRSISGGILVQDEDTFIDREFQSVTNISFDTQKQTMARFGVQACKHLKSNAICLISETNTGAFWLSGAGMGQPNRLDALRYLTIPRFELKEGVEITEAVMISDAFFPFRDSIDIANEFNIKYIIQPGGSIRDEEVIAACNEFDIAMAFTGKRHFRH
jgi:phosphoribosylaminoimidazolecarboxamide formyltransferase/IMP cyclohydrolase